MDNRPKTFCPTGDNCGSPIPIDNSFYSHQDKYIPKQVFAIDKSPSKYTLSRTFAIIPNYKENDGLDKYLQYSKMTKIFAKFNAYKNMFTQWLIAFYLKDELANLEWFKSKSVKGAGYIFNEFGLKNFKVNDYTNSKYKEYNFKLHTRLRRTAYYEAYISVRGWIKRRAYLREILRVIIEKFSSDDDFSIYFFSRVRFRYTDLFDFYPHISRDCFGVKSKVTVNYLNNMLGQIRNIFFQNFDFTVADSHPFELFIEQVIDSFRGNEDDFVSITATSFTKKEKGTIINIDQNDVFAHLLDSFFRRCTTISTNMVKRKQFERLKEFIGNDDIIDFKKKRNSLFHQHKTSYSKNITLNDVHKSISEVWASFLDGFFSENNHYLIKKIFNPPYISKYTPNISFESFCDFFDCEIYYKIRELFKFYFIQYDDSYHFLNYVIDNLEVIYTNIDDYLKIPVHKGFSIPINTEKIYDFIDKQEAKILRNNPVEKINNFIKNSHKDLFFMVNFIPHSRIFFHIIDSNLRFSRLIEQNVGFLNPTLTFKNCKILLNLPFQKDKGYKSIQRSGQFPFPNSDVQISVDLGLKHFAVLCVKENGYITKRYFLGAKELFNMKFDQCTGNLVYQEKCFDGYGHFIPRRLTNIKLKLINLRKEIENHQRLKNEYEDRLLDRGITNFRSKLKWNKLRKTISVLWQKVSNINSQIAKNVGHFIYEIAKYHQVNVIKFEDLSWSVHSKKKDRGQFLAKWQIHWLFSQMQTATADRCRSLDITVGVVDATNTSKNCSRCGRKGSRNGKIFTCKHCGLQLDSDLNASYNVVSRPIKSYI